MYQLITWDAVNKGTSVTLSNGNLTAIVPSNTNTVRASVGRDKGKFYWEVKVNAINTNHSMIGIVNSSVSLTANNYGTQNVRYYYSANGNKYPETTAYGASYTDNNVIGIALDLDNGILEFYKNGVSQGVSHTNIKTLGVVFPAVTSTSLSGNLTVTANFGATPFQHPVPTGYKAYNNNTVNKSFISMSDGYKKWIQGSPAIIGANTTPVMTSNTAPSGVVSASSIFSTTYDAWKAFNKTVSDVNDCWATASGTTTGWLQYEFPTSKIIEKYTITSRNLNELSAPKAWTFNGSNNLIDWVVIDTKANQINWGVAEKREFTTSNIKSYKYYRLNITENNGIATYVTIGELEIFEKSSSVIPPSWKTVSPTLPSLTQFQSEGIDDLSILDRKVQPVLGSPKVMTSEVLGVGKMYKTSIDLKKIFDLRKLEVK